MNLEPNFFLADSAIKTAAALPNFCCFAKISTLFSRAKKNTKLKFLYIVLSALKNICFKVGSFYSVKYVNVIYSVKGSTVDCKYLLFLQDFA